MSQPAVARLEIGEHLPTLIRVSDALDNKFLLDVCPKAHQPGWVSSEAGGAPIVECISTARGSQVLFAVS